LLFCLVLTDVQYNKKNVYAVAGSAVASYSILNDTSLRFDTSILTGGNCTSVHEIYVEASKAPPYSVYATPFGGDAQCGTVLSVLSNGTLSSVAQNYTYLTNSGVHGLAFSPNAAFVYSADDGANSVWTHSVDSTTGALTYVDRVAAPKTGADPRHATVHPGGEYLYVVYEGTSELAVYAINTTTGIPEFMNVTYPLLPAGTYLLAPNFFN
jgi:carboxy-cis,cis-muconate cyclase